jgi:hypothetical protein
MDSLAFEALLSSLPRLTDKQLKTLESRTIAEQNARAYKKSYLYINGNRNLKAIILIILFFYSLPSASAKTYTEAEHQKTLADNDCANKCVNRDYKTGTSFENQCACIDFVPRDKPIFKLPYNLQGKSVVDKDTLTVTYEFIK